HADLGAPPGAGRAPGRGPRRHRARGHQSALDAGTDAAAAAQPRDGDAMRAALVALALAWAAPSAAEPVTLRLATIAPDGTAWAREVRAFNRDVEALTHGQVRFKWYLGAIAGD